MNLSNILQICHIQITSVKGLYFSTLRFVMAVSALLVSKAGNQFLNSTLIRIKDGSTVHNLKTLVYQNILYSGFNNQLIHPALMRDFYVYMEMPYASKLFGELI